MQHHVLVISPEPGLVARLIKSEKPADVVHAGAACLAQMLDGFAWVRSRLTLERRTAGRHEVIGLAKSKYNRAGQLIEVRVDSLTVFDDALGAWRRAHPGLWVESTPFLGPGERATVRLAPLDPSQWRHLQPGQTITMHEDRTVAGTAVVLEVHGPAATATFQTLRAAAPGGAEKVRRGRAGWGEVRAPSIAARTARSRGARPPP